MGLSRLEVRGERERERQLMGQLDHIEESVRIKIWEAVM